MWSECFEQLALFILEATAGRLAGEYDDPAHEALADRYRDADDVDCSKPHEVLAKWCETPPGDLGIIYVGLVCPKWTRQHTLADHVEVAYLDVALHERPRIGD